MNSRVSQFHGIHEILRVKIAITLFWPWWVSAKVLHTARDGDKEYRRFVTEGVRVTRIYKFSDSTISTTGPMRVPMNPGYWGIRDI